jgi:Bacteriophage tail sheath protein
MPATLTYPGVYIEEIPSGVRTIVGVATSITAFLGRAPRGPTNEPTTINSFGDFERRFGGLDVDYPMSYAVRDFYLNGGSQAIIVRLYVPPSDTEDGNARLSVDDLKLVAASPGDWGQGLRASMDVDVSDEMRTRLGIGKDDALFNLTVRDSNPGGTTEKLLNLTVVDSARRLDRVLKDQSNLARWDGDWPSEATDLPKLPKVKTAREKLKALQDALKASPPVQATIDAARDAYEKAVADLEDAATQAEKKLAKALQAKPQVPDDITSAQTELKTAVDAMKGSPGKALSTDTDVLGDEDKKTGMYALAKADLFNLLCIPPDTRGGDTSAGVYQGAMEYCAARRAMLVVDSPAAWSENPETAAANAKAGLSALGLTGVGARNAALYFPRVEQADPRLDGQLDTFVPCGIVAGVMARTDTNRGVWKAPAGLDASVNGVRALQVNLNDAENGMLNPLGINCLRFFPASGRVVWGSRTLRGADQLADEYKYVPVRRLALYIEESLYRGTQWVVFEPNDEPLWAQIRLNVGAFMHNLFRQGAFQGSTPREAYFVKCDKETTTQNDINLGIVNIIVGFAPLKPAEFVVIKIQQMAGQIET